jgi:hypothetical protein
MRQHFLSVIAVFVTSAAGQAAAQEPVAPVPETVPADVGFGEHEVADYYRFPDPDRYTARVDRRDAVDASSDRTILWPTAHTPHKGRLAVSNHMFVLTQASYSFTDDFQLTGSLVIPVASADTHAALSGKFTLSESENHVFSIQPYGAYRRGSQDLANTDFGMGVAGLVDFMITNDLVASLGAVAYGTLVAGTGEFTYENCQSRSDYIDGSCREVRMATNGFPSGGHFVGAQLGVSWYIFDWLSLRGEFMTGLAAGSVMGSEWLTRGVNPVEEGDRYEDGDLGIGVPYDSDVALGGGLQWSNGMFAAQLSGYVLRGPPDNEFQPDRIFYLIPMANVGVALF